jgi:hypothetical protein
MFGLEKLFDINELGILPIQESLQILLVLLQRLCTIQLRPKRNNLDLAQLTLGFTYCCHKYIVGVRSCLNTITETKDCVII